MSEAMRDISYYLMTYYNWQRPHQHNDGLPPAIAEDRFNLLSGISRPLHTDHPTLDLINKAGYITTPVTHLARSPGKWY